MAVGLQLEHLPFNSRNSKLPHHFCLHLVWLYYSSLLVLRSGYNIITTCSSDSLEYVKSLGADFVVDYTVSDAPARIREYTKNTLRFAWDTISIEQSATFCANSLTTSSQLHPVYGSLLPVRSPRSDVKSVSTVMYTVFGKSFKFGSIDMPASSDDYQFGKAFFSITEELLNQVSWSIT